MRKFLLFPTRTLGLSGTILIICAGIVYWELGFGLLEDGGFVWDEHWLLALHSLSQPWLDSLFIAVTHTGDILLVLPVLAMLVYLWRRSEKITAALLVASAVVFPLVGLVIKEQFGRPRQDLFPPLVVEHTFSFPSGHTMTAVGVYGLIAVLLWQRGHRLLGTLSGIWVFMIALSRVYLGAHYPSDVLASLALGTIVMIIILFIDRRLNARKNPQGGGTMTEAHAGIVVGVLGQWASGKTEAARTLIRHLGGKGKVVFLTDRALFASQVIQHLLEHEDSEVVVRFDDDGGRRMDCELVTVWLAPGEDLRSLEPSTLKFDIHDDEILLAFRHRAKMELGPQIRERSAGGRPVVVEAAFGPNPEQAGENSYGRTIADLFARLEGAGVEAWQVKWIIVEASCDTRAERNAKRQDKIPVHYFERFAADGGDLAPDHERRLVEQGTLIRRVPNEHDDVERFRADIVAAFENMCGSDSLESRVSGRRERE